MLQWHPPKSASERVTCEGWSELAARTLQEKLRQLPCRQAASHCSFRVLRAEVNLLRAETSRRGMCALDLARSVNSDSCDASGLHRSAAQKAGLHLSSAPVITTSQLVIRSDGVPDA